MNEILSTVLDALLALMSTIIMFKLKSSNERNERREREKELRKETRNKELIEQIKALQNEIKKTNERQEKNSNCINALMKDKIYKRCEQLLIIGEVTTDDLKELEELVRPYFANGGNGIGQKSYEQVLNLKRVDNYEK